MGPLGWQETVFIFLLALLIFGPKKLPELGRNIGKALTEFRRVSGELRSTFDREMANIERETAGIKEEANKLTGEVQSSFYDHSDHSHYDESGYGYESYSYPDSTPEYSSDLAHLDSTVAEESSSAVTESVEIAQAEGSVAVGSDLEPTVPSTAESATEPAKEAKS